MPEGADALIEGIVIRMEPIGRAAGVPVGPGCDTVINDIFEVMRHAFVMHTQSTGIPLYDPWSFATQDAMTMATIDVETVMVAGRVLVEGARLLTSDEKALLPEAERLGARRGDVLGPRRYRPLPGLRVTPAKETNP